MSVFNKITEQDSLYDGLEKMDTTALISAINDEDHKVAQAVSLELPRIAAFVDDAYSRLNDGGRLFYIGAGTSGRLGILDASECPPTFGVDPEKVIGIIAGGDKAIRSAVEFAEDDTEQAYKDLLSHKVSSSDVVIGIAASGTTPYVIGGIETCNTNLILTGAITCNPGSPLAKAAVHPIMPVVGPEFVTGSSRMKAGTAQKMILNIISTTLMIKLGKVKGNKMIDMQLSNDKLRDRGVRMIVEATGLDLESAMKQLLTHGSVRAAIDNYRAR